MWRGGEGGVGWSPLCEILNTPLFGGGGPQFSPVIPSFATDTGDHVAEFYSSIIINSSTLWFKKRANFGGL